MTRTSRWPLADITSPRPAGRALGDVVSRAPEWFHFEVRNEVVGEQTGTEPTQRSTADVYVFDRVGGWIGITADDFVRDVAGLDVDHIDLHLNSPGGDAFEGIAIANVLRQHRADVTVWVDGIAASAASVIAMAGDEVVMSVGAQLMIHDASAVAMGDAADLRKTLAMLDSTSDAIASTYAAKAGGTAEEWRAVMVAETWYTAEEAVAAGLADRAATSDDKATASGEQIVPGSSTSFWDMWDSLGDAQRHTETIRALYAHAGRADAPPPQMPGRPAGTQTPAASAGGFTSHQEDDDMSTLTEGLRQRLGIAENADEATILAALDEALAEQAEPRQTSASLPEGAVAVDAAALAQLRADAAAGREAREQQIKARREGIVDAAIAEGKVLPRARASWLKNVEIDEDGTVSTLASMEPIVALNEVGHASEPAVQDSDLSWFDTTTSSSREG